VYTIIETPTFTRLWPDYWTEDERGEFVAWLALHPEVGDVVKSSGGVSKGSLVAPRHREARRSTSDPLQPLDRWRDLFARDVR
jgi:hypothetical protein